MSTSASSWHIDHLASFRVPGAPVFALDWAGLDDAFAWIRALKGSPHDPIHHREGDPWVHTHMVLEHLVADPEWRALNECDRATTFIATVMHDIAKPATAEIHEDGRVTNRGHSRVGAIMARRILWEAGVHPHLREQVCALIERHQVPFWLYERERVAAQMIVASQSVVAPNRLLWVLARADARGRICDDRDMMIEAVEDYARTCVEHDCLDAPFPFHGDHERFMFLSGRAEIDPRYKLGADITRPVVTILSGLPGAGKSDYVRNNAGDQPVIALDALRRQMGVDPTENQGRVVEAARELAKGYLRERRSFIWDATAFTKEMRGKTIDLCRLYDYAIRIVAVDTSCEIQTRQNKDREHPVPASIIGRMLDKWEFPRPDEYHELVWLVRA
jgi:predicted kinase